jgi:hypothetical protein
MNGTDWTLRERTVFNNLARALPSKKHTHSPSPTVAYDSL